jgi:hypothetical protein
MSWAEPPDYPPNRRITRPTASKLDAGQHAVLDQGKP